MPVLEFWYEFASTYSYPAAMRVEKVAGAKGVAVRWRPFLLGPIFAAQGWNDSPFNLYPAKGKNMWRDLERICADLDIPLRQPPFRFPQKGLKAARIALALEREGFPVAEFSRRVYLANFAQQKDISDEDRVLGSILSDLQIRVDLAVAVANGPENKQRLKNQTNEAIARGIYGAPSFTVGEELFW